MEQYLPIINTIGVVGLTIYGLYSKFGKQKAALATDVAALNKEVTALYDQKTQALQEQINLLNGEILRMRERNHELGNQITPLNLSVGRLEGQLLEKDKRIEELMLRVQAQNPDLEAYIKTSSEALAEIRDFMKKWRGEKGATR